MNNPLNPSAQSINLKLASLLTILITFQQKIEILRTKLCGHPSFSPQLYYKQIDRCDKGYIDTQDFITFIKKGKPNFNIDHRYLRPLFTKLNQDQHAPKDRLTYFGYLNLIKPYFDSQLARDVLLRDSVAVGSEVNLVTKRLLDDLVATLYVCVAEHERVKEMVIMGDLDQGGSDPGALYNIYQLLDIIKRDGEPQRPPIGTQISINPIPNPNQNPSNPNLQPSSSRTLTPNTASIRSTSNLSPTGILDTFYNFIINNSEYEVQRGDMKFLLAYLMCHQFMLTNQKYLTVLFMPVCAVVDIGKDRDREVKPVEKEVLGGKMATTEMNFLRYVHPNSVTDETLQNYKNKSKRPPPKQSLRDSINPQTRPPRPQTNQPSSQAYIDEEPRILIKAPQQNSLQTPILEKFMRESKVLKNMSRYRNNSNAIHEQESSHSESAFISESKYRNPVPQAQDYLNPNNIGTQHRQKPANKDFNLQEVLTNSNLHKSEYYQNLSMRAMMKEAPMQPNEMVSPSRNATVIDGSGILNDFMLR